MTCDLCKCDIHQYYILALAEETQLYLHISGIANA